jgi:hypothetical protein
VSARSGINSKRASAHWLATGRMQPLRSVNRGSTMAPLSTPSRQPTASLPRGAPSHSRPHRLSISSQARGPPDPNRRSPGGVANPGASLRCARTRAADRGAHERRCTSRRSMEADRFAVQHRRTARGNSKAQHDPAILAHARRCLARGACRHAAGCGVGPSSWPLAQSSAPRRWHSQTGAAFSPTRGVVRLARPARPEAQAKPAQPWLARAAQLPAR